MKYSKVFSGSAESAKRGTQFHGQLSVIAYMNLKIKQSNSTGKYEHNKLALMRVPVTVPSFCGIQGEVVMATVFTCVWYKPVLISSQNFNVET